MQLFKGLLATLFFNKRARTYTDQIIGAPGGTSFNWKSQNAFFVEFLITSGGATLDFGQGPVEMAFGSNRVLRSQSEPYLLLDTEVEIFVPPGSVLVITTIRIVDKRDNSKTPLEE